MAEKAHRARVSHNNESGSQPEIVQHQSAAPETWQPAIDFDLRLDGETRERSFFHLQQTVGNQAVQRMVNRSRAVVNPADDLAQRIHAASSGGNALDSVTRHRLQEGFNVDLSAVRIHTDDEADRLSRSAEAIAFTTGQDIFFRRGAYQPETAGGLRLIAHEAAHTIQQSNGLVDGTLTSGDVSISDPSDAFEQEADKAADRVIIGQSAQVHTPSGPIVARSPVDPNASSDDSGWMQGAQSLVRGLLGLARSGQPPALPASVPGTGSIPAEPVENSIDDLLVFLRNQAGFHAGAEMPPTFNSRSASPFGTRAHGLATDILEDMQSAWPESQRIISEPRIVNGEITSVGQGPAGAPSGAHVPDYVVLNEAPLGSVVGRQVSDVGERIGDLKYGGGEIAQKYAAHGLPLETQRGLTQAPPETPPVGGYEDFRLGPEFDRPGLPPETSAASSVEEAAESATKGGGGTFGKIMGGANYGLQFFGNLMQGQGLGESTAGAAAGGFVGNRVSGGGWDTAINLANAGLQLLGAPKEVTGFTQMAADATPSSFATSLASNAGRGAWNLLTGDTAALKRQGQDILHGKSGSALQGWGMITDLVTGGDTDWMTGEAAKRGDYGFAVQLGNQIGDDWFELNQQYGGFGGTLKEFGSEFGDFLWEGATGKGGIKGAANWVGDKASDAWDWTKSTVSDVGSAIGGAAESAWDWTSDTVSDVGSAIGGAASDAWDWLAGNDTPLLSEEMLAQIKASQD